MKVFLLVTLLSSSLVQAEEWTPPSDPDPHAILEAAQDDMDAKNYASALAKHVWYHNNALSIDPHLHGVRLSFALSHWAELAKVHGPALRALEQARDTAQYKVFTGIDVRHSFHDMKAINDVLGEHEKTKSMFELLDAQDPASAKVVFHIAQPALVESKSYALVGKYISPKEDFARMKEGYDINKFLASQPGNEDLYGDFANKKFLNSTTTLIAILVVNDRHAEAATIADAARNEWDDKAFHAAIEQALTGAVPDPWP